MSNPNKICTQVFSALAITSLSSVATAQLEEIVVTATKRAENLQDVPISVSAITGDKIAKTGIQRLKDAIVFTPNVTIVGTEIGDSINIRGIQSGNQAGFEQSVATFVDGVYRGRSVQSRFSFLDLERLEVLRGPQGTLFGKNVVAGALNITSATPTEELSGSVKANYNPEFDETEFTGFVSGSLSNSVRGRLAFVDRTMDEGWLRNDRYSSDDPQVDESAVRLALAWDIDDSSSLNFKHEQGGWDNSGVPWEHVQLGPLAVLAPFGVEANADYRGQVGTFPLAPDPNQELGSSQLFEGDSSETVLRYNKELTGGGEITAIASLSSYEFERLVDADVSILDTLNFNDEEDFEQSTFEIRFASDPSKDFNYILGGFYLDADLVTEGNTPLGVAAVNQAVAGGCAAGGGTTVPFNPGLDDPNFTAFGAVLANAGLGTSAGVANACALASLAGPLSAAGVQGFNRYVILDQNTESWAIFGQMNWKFNDALSATAGLRFTQEDKTASHQSIVANYGVDSKTPSQNPLAFALAGLLGEYAPHRFDGLSREEDKVTWSANLQWDPSDNLMAYVSASTGFKGGGFNSFYLSQTPDRSEIDFEEEEVITFEIGTKMRLMDDAAELNLAVFRSEYDDLQVSVFSGSTTFNVDNAAEATTQGIEIDGRWQINDRLLLSGALGIIDFEFDSFPNQGCTDAQFNNFRESSWANGTNPFAAFFTSGTCANAGVNDLSGRTSAQTPDYTASLSALYEQPLSENLNLNYGLDILFRGKSFRQEDLDINALDDSSVYVNALLSLYSTNETWSIILNAYNLTDEESFDLGQDVPLASGAHFIQPKAPRSFAVSVLYNF